MFIFPRPEPASALSLFETLFGKKSIKQEQNSQTVALLKANLSPDLGARGGGGITIVGDAALLPDAGPLGTSGDLVDETPSDQISVYVVRKGDSISQIAKMFNVTASTIIWANDLSNGVIKEGQTLIVLPVSGVRHVVKEGDTVSGIAKKYKGDVNEIAQFNDLTPGQVLAAGSVVIVPDGEGGTIHTTNGSRPTTNKARNINGPSYTGYYINPVPGGRKSQGLHGYNAVDLAASTRTPIIAAASGDVIVARDFGWNGGYGTYIVIAHANGTQTLYAHNSENIVGPGWHVVQGQVIGYVGNTGKSTGSHTHFEIRGAKNPF